MKITFLGTGAAEGIPTPFCACATCLHARTHRGVNVRRRSSIVVNDDLLVDAGPDLFSSCVDFGICLNSVRYILVTHSHFDHFYSHNLEIRSSRYREAKGGLATKLVAGPSTLLILDQMGINDQDMAIERVPMLPFNSINLPPYSVRSIAASHAHNLGDAMNYIIEDGRTRVLYATDTGRFTQKTLEHIAGLPFSTVIVESTNGNGWTGKSHMNIEGVKSTIEQLKDIGSLTGETAVVATHISHMSNPPHGELADILSSIGVLCAFDGLVLPEA